MLVTRRLAAPQEFENPPTSHCQAISLDDLQLECPGSILSTRRVAVQLPSMADPSTLMPTVPQHPQIHPTQAHVLSKDLCVAPLFTLVAVGCVPSFTMCPWPHHVHTQYNGRTNPMLGPRNTLKGRLDRVWYRTDDFVPVSCVVVGRDALPGVQYDKETKSGVLRLPVLPSDHYGLLTRFARRPGNRLGDA